MHDDFGDIEEVRECEVVEGFMRDVYPVEAQEHSRDISTREFSIQEVPI